MSSTTVQVKESNIYHLQIPDNIWAQSDDAIEDYIRFHGAEKGFGYIDESYEWDETS